MSSISLIDHRTQIATYGYDLLRTYPADLTNISELHRHFYAIFLFGVLYFYTGKQNLKPSDDQTLTTWMLMDVLAFDVDKATAFAKQLIQIGQSGMTTSQMEKNKNTDPHYFAKVIIHRGMLGQRQLASKDFIALRQNVNEILTVANKVWSV